MPTLAERAVGEYTRRDSLRDFGPESTEGTLGRDCLRLVNQLETRSMGGYQGGVTEMIPPKDKLDEWSRQSRLQMWAKDKRMISPAESEERYAAARARYSSMSVEALTEHRDKFFCPNGTVASLLKRLKIKTINTASKWRALKDELDSRFAREGLHDILGYDS